MAAGQAPKNVRRFVQATVGIMSRLAQGAGTIRLGIPQMSAIRAGVIQEVKKKRPEGRENYKLDENTCENIEEPRTVTASKRQSELQ